MIEPDFERRARMPWPTACCASSGAKLLSSAFVFEVRVPGADKDSGELRPGIGSAHIHNANGLNPRFRWLDAEQCGGLAALDTTPEFPLRGDNEMLIERVGMGLDLDPFATARNDREHRVSCRHDPHIVLQLRHIFLSGRFFRE